jgi:hypothetical protein
VPVFARLRKGVGQNLETIPSLSFELREKTEFDIRITENKFFEHATNLRIFGNEERS